MKAIVFDKKHLPSKQRLDEVEKPLPNDNEVLLKVVSVSVNAADYRTMKMGMIPKKKIFGSAVSGTVESVGKNIQQFKPGDEIIGDLSGCGFGGFAEYAVAPEKVLIPKPEKIMFEEAATLPIAAITALQALRMGNIQKGQKALIVGSGGGVGTFAVQLAKYFGAKVTAVCSTKNLEQTSSLGADHVVDYSKEDFTKSNKSYDLILAINGNYPLLAYKRILNGTGIYVMVGGALSQILKSLLFGWLMSFGAKKMYSLLAKSSQNDLEFMAKLVEDGKIKPVIDRRYSLDNVEDAMRYLGEGHARGKVVINLE